MNAWVGVGLERLVLAATVADRQIEIASRNGGSMLKLRARLRGLIDGSGIRDRVVDHVEERLALERQYWIAALREALSDESCARILEALRTEPARTPREGGRDPWAPLDIDACWSEHEAMRDRVDEAVNRILEASLRFARTGAASHLRDAVDEVDRALHVERDCLDSSCMTVEDARDEGERFANALRRALPPPAFRFLTALVRSTIERELRLRNYELKRDGDHLLSTGDWTRASDDEEPADRVFFQGSFQRRYEEQISREAAWREARDAAACEVRAEASLERATPTHPHHGAPDTVEHVRSPRTRPEGIPEEYVLVQLPTGPKWLAPAMARACQNEMIRRARLEAARQEREEVKREYYAKIGKRYPD